jgi:hypothetical protein
MPEGQSEFQEIIWFQYNIADRWLKRGRNVNDPFAQFFFFYAGFNALYFLWRIIDKVEKGEVHQIDNLVRKLNGDVAERMLESAWPSVAFFIERPPLQRMGERTAKSPYFGETGEGRKWHHRLANTTATPVDRLVALAQILYLVRNNLAHGSKVESGDDEVIVRHAAAALETVLAASVELTWEYGPVRRVDYEYRRKWHGQRAHDRRTLGCRPFVVRR